MEPLFRSLCRCPESHVQTPAVLPILLKAAARPQEASVGGTHSNAQEVHARDAAHLSGTAATERLC